MVRFQPRPFPTEHLTVDADEKCRPIRTCRAPARNDPARRGARTSRDALISAVNVPRARGFGLASRMENPWDRSPIVGNAMKAILGYEVRLKRAGPLDATSVLPAAAWTLEREIDTSMMRPSDAHRVSWLFIDELQDIVPQAAR
jgi:hypothetical protein